VGPRWVRVRNEGIKRPFHLSLAHLYILKTWRKRREESLEKRGDT